MIFSTTTKVKVIGTPAFFFRVKNPVSSGNSKVHGTTMGPGNRGILKSPRGTGALSTNGLNLVAIIPTFTGTSHRGIKGSLSIIDGDTHMGILFKGARGVVTDHKGTLNIITQAVMELLEFGSIIPGKFYCQGDKLGIIINIGRVFLS